MGCATCSNNNGTPAGCKSNGSCGNGGCNKLTVFNWLANMELPKNASPYNGIEVRFKNGRKEFYRNETELSFYEGDVVVVEAAQGYDIGIVSLSGELVRLQLQKKALFQDFKDLNKILRKANQEEIDKWQKGRAKEAEGMLKARKIANDLDLHMKISDVEFQGDQSKVVFYYTADERVDFRELIRKLAEAFKSRIEMKQIGMRQEAGRLGGIGSCGRELCCSTWLTDFRSVSTSAARYQQLSLNPSKLAGQCGKLKCCLNYELDTYMDELKAFPDTKVKLKTEKGNAFFQKMDIFGQTMWYSYEDSPYDFVQIELSKVKEVIATNKSGKKVAELPSVKIAEINTKEVYANVVGQDDLSRFDKLNKSNKRKKRRKPRRKSKNQQS